MLETLRLSWHIVRRNWWVYRKDFIANVSPTVIEPGWMLLSLGLGLGAFVAEIEGRSYVQFIAPGLAVSTAMFTAFFETSYNFYVRMTFENIIKAMLTTPIGVGEIIIGEFLWVSLKGALMMTGVTLFLVVFGLFANPYYLFLVPIVGMLIAFPLGAIGLLASCWVKNINQFQSYYAFLIGPSYFFSGIFFPVEQMPVVAQWVAKALPLYHGVQLAQSLFWDQNIARTMSFHGSVLVVYSAVLAVIAYSQLKRKLLS